MANKISLSCGLNLYQGGLSPLYWAERDAEMMHDAFLMWGFEGHKIVGEAMQKGEVFSGIERYAGRRPDLFVLFAAVHGETIGEQHYLHCCFSRIGETREAIDLHELEFQIRSQIRPWKLLFILDACRAASDGKPQPVFRPEAYSATTRMARAIAADDWAAGEDETVRVFGCEPEKECREDPAGDSGNGFLTASLLEVLRTDPDGCLHASFEDVKRRVRERSKNLQTPVLVSHDAKPIYLKRPIPIDSYEDLTQKLGSEAPIHSIAVAGSLIVAGVKDRLICFSATDDPWSINASGEWVRAIAVGPSKIAWSIEGLGFDGARGVGIYDLGRKEASPHKTEAPCRGVGIFRSNVVAAMKDGEIRSFAGNIRSPKAPGDISAAAFGNTRLAVAMERLVGERAAFVYDTELNCVAEIVHERPFISIAISSDDRHLGATDTRNTVLIWELAETGPSKGRETAATAGTPVTAMAFSPSEPRLAFAVADSYRRVFIWDFTSGEEPRQFASGTGIVTALQFSARGDLLYIADARGGLRRWYMRRRAVKVAV